MTLVACADLSAASWISAAGVPWDRLVGFGPAGFEAYARLRFLPDPAYPGQSENDVQHDAALSELEQLRRVLGTLSRHTSTPDDCYFCLWDGWGPELEGGDTVWELDERDGKVRPGPRMAPAFPPSVLYGPKVVVPHRSYLLFRGPVADLGDWGAAADLWPGQPRLDMPVPAFVWPADHAWCVARDVDPHWAGLGATGPAVRQLLTDPDLDVVPADPAQDQPAYR